MHLLIRGCPFSRRVSLQQRISLVQCGDTARLESLAQEEARMRGRMLGSLSRYQAGRQAGAVTPALCQVPDTVGETCSHSHDWAAQGSDLRKQPGDGYRDRV